VGEAGGRAVILAVVPAAGHSTRMGRPKLALPLGDRTVLEHVVAALRAGGADHVVVVVGPHVPQLLPLATAAGADVCPLPEPTADMRATVEHGLNWLEARHHPQPADAWLLAPADHPALDPAVIRALCNSFNNDPAKSILIPVHGGRRGHPALVAWRHAAGVRALPADRGINSYFRDHAAEVVEVPVAGTGVLCDLDTPEDYDRWKEWVRRSGLGGLPVTPAVPPGQSSSS
jgi:molybdenum cofactor cytidylyltransferase